MLKLFRDYVFHQVNDEGQPVLDLAHVLESLNKFEIGACVHCTALHCTALHCTAPLQYCISLPCIVSYWFGNAATAVE
jgi:hypothetical protein